MEWSTAGVLITAMLGLFTLVIVAIPKKRTHEQCPDIKRIKLEMEEYKTKVEGNNLELKSVKKDSEYQAKAIDGFRGDIRKLFDKIDDIHQILIKKG